MNIQQKPTISKAFNLALTSCLHPKVWVAFLVPVLVFIITSILLASFLWDKIDAMIDYSLSLISWVNVSQNWMITTLGFGFLGLFSWLATFLTVALLGAMVAVIFTSLVVTDMLMKHIHKKHYPHLIPKGVTLTSDIKNTLYYALVLLITIIIGLPLWFFPPVAFIWQLYWTRFFFSRSMPFDTLCNYASDAEIKYIRKQYVNPNEKIGLFCALINYIPLAALITPIFAILWFGHFNMALLDQERSTLNHLNG